jgi:uncharacterized membrane protein YoaK (UPF0700 family)
MKRTRWSLYYLAAYLVGAGVALILAPSVALALLFSNGHYGDVMPRLLGVVLFALGVLIVQVTRHRLEVLYPTTLLVRSVIVAVLVGLLLYSRDPLFASLLVVVGLGMILTGTGYVLDRQRHQSAAASSR